jgi:hypothetical protein
VLFRQGREAMKKGDLATACPKFAESQRLDPAAGTLVNLAQCEEKQGKLAAAWQHWREAAEQLPAGDERLVIAKQRIQALDKRVPKLVVKLGAGAPADTKVTRDGVELGAASLDTALPVDPGEHVVVAVAPGRSAREIKVEVGEGKTETVVVEPGEVAAAAGAAAPGSQDARSDAALGAKGSPPAKEAPRSGGGATRTAGWVIAGLGVVGLGVGTVFALRAKSKNDEALAKNENGIPRCLGEWCVDPKGIDLTTESRRASMIAIPSLVVGGAALVGGAVMVLVAPPSDSPKPAKVGLKAAFGPGALGAQLGGEW